MKKVFCLLFLVCSSLFANSDVLQKEWKTFVSQYPSLRKFSSDEIARVANQWGQKVRNNLSVQEPIRGVDPIVIEKMKTLLQEDNAKIFMRHGEQQKTKEISLLPAPEQKIAMMRLPDNFENPLTNASIAEWMEGMIVFEYLKQKTARSFLLESSSNKRAEIPASSLAYALKTNLRLDKSLNCVNYPPQNIMSTAEILKLLPEGTLPWEKAKVDTIIGAGTYDRITNDMQKLLSTLNTKRSIFMVITHTQQINAVATLSNLPAARLGNFGCVIVTSKSKEVLSDGFYKKI